MPKAPKRPTASIAKIADYVSALALTSQQKSSSGPTPGITTFGNAHLSAAAVNGSAIAGTVTFTTDGSAGTGNMVGVLFASPFPGGTNIAPVLFPNNATSAAAVASISVSLNENASGITGFDIATANQLSDGVYTWFYQMF